MKEETAQESGFTSIFKDYLGRWWSENVVFIATTSVCLFIALQASIVDSVLVLAAVFSHGDFNSAIVAYSASITGLIGTLQTIAAVKKSKAVDQVFDKDIKNKELDNVQPPNA